MALEDLYAIDREFYASHICYFAEQTAEKSLKAVLAELARLVKAEFAKMEVTEGMYKSMANSIRASKGEKYIFHYDPAVLILTANRADYSNNIADCACVLENMMVMANALDLGSCWINRVDKMVAYPEMQQLMKAWGLPDGLMGVGSLAIGYPDGTPHAPKPRKEGYFRVIK